MFSRCSQGVCRIFFQDVFPMLQWVLWAWRNLMIISNESRDFNDPKEFDNPKSLMDFDNAYSTVIPPSPMLLFQAGALFCTERLWHILAILLLIYAPFGLNNAVVSLNWQISGMLGCANHPGGGVTRTTSGDRDTAASKSMCTALWCQWHTSEINVAH